MTDQNSTNESLENPFINSEKKDQKTSVPDKNKKDFPEKKIDSNEELSVEEDEHLLDTEEDGDIYWVIQKIAWSVLKFVLIGGGIFAVLFFFVGDFFVFWEKTDKEITLEESVVNKQTKNIEKKETSPNVDVEKKIKILEKEISTNPQENFNKKSIVISNKTFSEILLMHEWAAQIIQKKQQNLINRVLSWNKLVENIYDQPLNKSISSDNNFLRKKQTDNILRIIEESISQGYEHYQSILKIESMLIKNKARYQGESNFYTQVFLNSIANSNGENSKSALKKKITAEQLVTRQKVENEALKLLKEKLLSYDKVLRNSYDLLKTNYEAIINNISVVDFPNDPFGTVKPYRAESK